MRFALVAAVLATTALAVQVTFPTETQGWDTNGSEEIEWKVVDTDPQNFDIQLQSPSSGTPVTIASNISAAVGSYIYTPSGPLTAGGGYRINLVQGGILAQSPQFNVTTGTSTVTPTSGMPSSTSASMSMTMSSTSASASASASKSGSASHLAAPGGLALFVLGAMGALA